jgi:hypothetical protein
MINGKLYSEILDEFQKAENKSQRIEILRKYDHPRFREFLQLILNTNIEFDVPIPNYRPAIEPAGLNYTYLESEVPKLYRFIKNHPKRAPGLTPQKQSSLLTVILESLYHEEAEILVQVLTKKYKISHLTNKLIEETFLGK